MNIKKCIGDFSRSQNSKFADEMVGRMVVPEFATTKPALVHEYREVSESDRAWDIEQTLQKRILKEIWRWA